MASNNQQVGQGKAGHEVGKKSGEPAHQQKQSGGDHRQQGGHDDKRRGENPGNVANDPQRAGDTGRKGGQH